MVVCFLPNPSPLNRWEDYSRFIQPERTQQMEYSIFLNQTNFYLKNNKERTWLKEH